MVEATEDVAVAIVGGFGHGGPAGTSGYSGHSAYSAWRLENTGMRSCKHVKNVLRSIKYN